MICFSFPIAMGIQPKPEDNKKYQLLSYCGFYANRSFCKIALKAIIIW
jgi:hypothetical protein